MLKEKKTITSEDIQATIKSIEFSKIGKKTSVCLITLKNGYELVGTSSCVDESNFSQEIGNKYSLEKAKDQIWMLEGYKLQDSLK